MNYSLDRIAKKNLYNRDRLKYSGETKRLKGLVVTKPFQILDFWFCRNICPWFFLHKSCFSGTFLYKVQTGFLYFSTVTMDAHGLKIQGRGYLMFFAKIPRGVKAFRKNCLGGPPISGFIAFLLTSVLKFAWGGYCIYPQTGFCIFPQ